jgi:hypothetical protein
VAVLGLKKLFGTHNPEGKAHDIYDTQMQELAQVQQQTAMMEQQATAMEQQAGGKSYKDSVSPDEYQHMQSQMRDGGQDKGFTATQDARRAAAAEQATQGAS